MKPSWVRTEEAGRPGPPGPVRTDARVREEEAEDRKQTRTGGRAAPSETAAPSGRAREDERDLAASGEETPAGLPLPLSSQSPSILSIPARFPLRARARKD